MCLLIFVIAGDAYCRSIFQNLTDSTEISEILPLNQEGDPVIFESEDSFLKQAKLKIRDLLHNQDIDFEEEKKLSESERIFGFFYKNIPLCGYKIKVVLRKDGTIYTVGYIPHVEIEESLYEISFEEALHTVKEFLKSSEENILKIKSYSHCLFVKNGIMRSAWSIVVQKTEGFYEMLADSKHLYENFPLSLDSLQQGKMLAFKEQPNVSPLAHFYELVENDGTLTNDIFVTDTTINSYNSVPRAVEKSLVFEYSVLDPRFQEVSAFVHAMKARDFFINLGYKEDDNVRVVLSLHNVFNNSPNNASFYPSSVSPYGLPSILFGDGDGVNYGSFAVDSDVVTHEYSHYIIYRYLYPSREESAVLHEGLADFFSETRRNDPCFAASICISNSACFNQCLRTAKNSIQYRDVFFDNNEIHLKSLVISGMLWDLYEALGTDINAIVFHSLKYLVYNSGYKQFLMGLLLADQDLFKGQHACSIFDAAQSRNFGDFLKDIDCNDYKTIPKPILTPTKGATSKKSQKCAMVLVAGKNYPSSFVLYFFFLLPILVFLAGFLRLRQR
jgi:hypothetical protein